MSDPKLCHLALWLEPLEIMIGILLEKWSPSSHNILRCTTVIGLPVFGFKLFPLSVQAQFFFLMRSFVLCLALRLLGLGRKILRFSLVGLSVYAQFALLQRLRSNDMFRSQPRRLMARKIETAEAGSVLALATQLGYVVFDGFGNCVRNHYDLPSKSNNELELDPFCSPSPQIARKRCHHILSRCRMAIRFCFSDSALAVLSPLPCLAVVVRLEP